MMVAPMVKRGPLVALTLAFVVLVGRCAPGVRAQSDPHATLDRILDVYVRDGLVYYAALRTERAGLDRYLTSLEQASWVATAPEAEQRAFWLNAYNALVLRTVINAYPIAGKGEGYPAASVGQIPGAFDKTRHRIAGQVLTLDEIEKTVIAGFGDARMLIALGRGTLGSGRLRSEAYTAARLNDQLDQGVEEFVKRADVFRIDRTLGLVEVTPLFSWRETAFVQSYAAHGEANGERWKERSPLERALMAMVHPHRLPSEREFLAQNTFQMKFGAYDWRLNDLTGGAPIR